MCSAGIQIDASMMKISREVDSADNSNLLIAEMDQQSAITSISNSTDRENINSNRKLAEKSNRSRGLINTIDYSCVHAQSWEIGTISSDVQISGCKCSYAI
jgi:hypothetical protein